MTSDILTSSSDCDASNLPIISFKLLLFDLHLVKLKPAPRKLSFNFLYKSTPFLYY